MPDDTFVVLHRLLAFIRYVEAFHDPLVDDLAFGHLTVSKSSDVLRFAIRALKKVPTINHPHFSQKFICGSTTELHIPANRVLGWRAGDAVLEGCDATA